MVANTSLMAYDELVASGKEKTQRAQILELVLMCGLVTDLTRRRISHITEIELGAVCGRVNKLVEDGLLDESEETVCPTTKKTVKLIKPVMGVQQDLF